MTVLKIVLVLCAGIPGIAQIRGPSFCAESAEVIVDISVLEHGHSLTGLSAADFAVFDDGAQQGGDALRKHHKATIRVRIGYYHD